jgi:aryl-alcohol dehydrogenase-like predicted oxidoreductase
VNLRKLAGRHIAPIGFGAMELSFRGRPSAADAIAHLRLVQESGVGVIDSAEAYCATAAEAGHNERLIAAAFASVPLDERPLVATKGGQYRTRDGGFRVDGSPNYLRRACERSLINLGADAIDLYYLHWPDPAVPLSESVGALAELAARGLVRHIGLCNVDTDQLDEARKIVAIHSVQAPLSPGRLNALPLVSRAAELDIAFLAYWPFGGRHAAPDLPARHPVLAAVAKRHGASAHQVALAWLLELGPTVIPIPGSRRATTLRDSVDAGRLQLSNADLVALNDAATAS